MRLNKIELPSALLLVNSLIIPLDEKEFLLEFCFVAASFTCNDVIAGVHFG